jgi:hypothetical protein
MTLCINKYCIAKLVHICEKQKGKGVKKQKSLFALRMNSFHEPTNHILHHGKRWVSRFFV